MPNWKAIGMVGGAAAVGFYLIANTYVTLNSLTASRYYQRAIDVQKKNVEACQENYKLALEFGSKGGITRPYPPVGDAAVGDNLTPELEQLKASVNQEFSNCYRTHTINTIMAAYYAALGDYQDRKTFNPFYDFFSEDKGTEFEGLTSKRIEQLLAGNTLKE